MRRISAPELGWSIHDTLVLRGVSAVHANDVAETLIQASLMGVDTHGVELLPVYLRELDGGRANLAPRLHLSPGKTGATVLDADNALGPVAAAAAAREATARAQRCGIGAVAVARSNHLGAAGVHARAMAAHGQIGIVVSNSDALVAPVGGRVPLLGTNPLAIAAPGQGEDGFFLDMATSAVAYTRVLRSITEGTLQAGWAIDVGGHDAVHGGTVAALLPAGGYKGQGLGMAVQLLSALLTRMPFDHELQNMYVEPYDVPRRIGHCFIAIEISAFLPLEEFRPRLTCWLDQFRHTPAATGERVRVPGDLERDARKERRECGIPVSDAVLAVLARRESASRRVDARAATRIRETAARESTA